MGHPNPYSYPYGHTLTHTAIAIPIVILIPILIPEVIRSLVLVLVLVLITTYTIYSYLGTGPVKINIYSRVGIRAGPGPKKRLRLRHPDFLR